METVETMRLIKMILISGGLLVWLSFGAACAKVEVAPHKVSSKISTASTAASASASPRADIVRAEAEPVEALAGGSTEALMHLTIAEGFHINANPPALPNLIPTELKVETENGITAGAPIYPTSVTRKFAFAEQPLKVYEGETIIKLPLRFDAFLAKGAHQLRARVRAQACDNEACYPPRTIETFIPVNVR
jgi:hypothetical protein